MPTDLLEQFGSTVKYNQGEEIYAQGDPPHFCYNLVSGCVRMAALLEDGRRYVGEFLWPGEFFGFNEWEQHEFAAEAVTDLTLWRYPRRAVEALAQTHAGLALWLREVGETKLRQARYQMLTLGRRSPIERIACFLLKMEERTGLLDTPMCRADIADHLGLTPETVCRILARLRTEGTLAVSRSGFLVRNRAALKEMAE